MSARLISTEHPKPGQPHMEIIDIARLRSELLSGEDKALVQMIFEKGSSFTEIAKLTGQHPSSIARRFRDLLQKLLTKELLALLRNQAGFKPVDITICRDYFLQGLPKRMIARKLNVSDYRIRKVLKDFQYLFYDGAPRIDNRIHKSTPKHKGTNDAHV
ncbi:MAG: hypothetical protein H8E62_05650 [Planctomycetes bacterium]|nr:hypothetical protein [Planctomycetota bacterium]